MPERSFTRDQCFLLPVSIDEWVAADDPVRYVAAFIEELPDEIWTELGVNQASDQFGAPRYAPKLLLSVWIAGFMFGFRSARKLEALCRRDLPFRWLTAGQTPDHNTLWRFYAAHRATMEVLLTRTVQTAYMAGLIDLATQAVDSTKVAANASKDRTYAPEALAKLLKRTQAAIADLEAQNRGGDDPPPPSLPAELAQVEALRDRIVQAMAQVEAMEKPRPVNLTDADARLMRSRAGTFPAYSVQVVATPLDPVQAGRTGNLILGTSVGTIPNDNYLLASMIEATHPPDWPMPITVADAGYYSGETVAACVEAGYPVVVPESAPAHCLQHPYHKDRFVYDPITDTYTCPAGQLFTFRRLTKRKHHQRARKYVTTPGTCQTCPAFGIGKCTRNLIHGRVLRITPTDDAIKHHRLWMQQPLARELLKRRKTLIEPVFGILKDQLGARRFLLRGVDKVNAEFTMLALAHNLRTLAKVWVEGMTHQNDRCTRAGSSIVPAG